MMSTPMESTYRETEKFIYHIAHRFRRRHGGDIDEIIATANVGFVHAYKDYNPEKGSFLACVRFYIWNMLLEEIRQNIRNRKYLETCDLHTVAEPYHSHFDSARFAQALTPQARLVLRLCISPPPNVLRQIQAKGNKPHNYRSVIRKYLMDLGWSYEDVNAAYREIKLALSESYMEL